MGWCSATRIFDPVVGALLDEKPVDKRDVIKMLIEVLEDGDWDCQQDSAYYDHPLVRSIFKELHPDWFEDEEPSNGNAP